MTTRFVRAGGGKSHSWLTPTTSRSRPSAKRISVADGSSETIRITKMYHAILNSGSASSCRGTGHPCPSQSLPLDLIFALFVEEILLPQRIKRVEIGVPAVHDFLRRRAALQLAYCLRIADKRQEFFRIKFIRIHLL